MITSRVMSSGFLASVGDGTKVELLSEQKWKGLEGVTGEDFGPAIVGRLWWMRQNPEVFLRMVDQGDGAFCGGGDGPGSAQEIDGVVGVDAAAELERQMQVEQRLGWRGLQASTLLGEGMDPGLFGAQTCGAAWGVVVAVDFQAEQFVGRAIVMDVFIGQQRHQPMLEGVETALDFAFGLGTGRDEVSHPPRL